MADCTWTRTDHAWLSRRNRSVVQQTREGREELARFETAPLLMDGRKDRVTGDVGANRVNQQKLEALSARTQKPIVLLRALHDRPDTPEGRAMKPELMDAEDFRGIEGELAFCEGARVLLTQNLWVDSCKIHSLATDRTRYSTGSFHACVTQGGVGRPTPPNPWGGGGPPQPREG